MVKRKKTEDILMNTDADDISMLAEIQTDTDDLSAIEFEKEIPIMPLRNMVMFPSVVMPVTIGRPSTLKLVNAAYKKKQAIAVVCQVQGDLDDPGFADLYHVGVIAKILRIFEMPGGNTTVIMQSNGPKIHLDNITKTIPYLKGTVTAINENNEEQDSDEFKALTDTCKDLTAKFIDVSEKLSPDTVFAIKNLDNPEILVDQHNSSIVQICQLLDFVRVKNIAPGETRHVALEIPVEELRFYDVISRRLMVEEGTYEIYAGASCKDKAVSTEIFIPGGKRGVRDLSAFTAADHYDDYENMYLTEGHFNFKAVRVQDETKEGVLVYRDCDLSDAAVLALHVKSERGGSVEAFVDGVSMGSFTGDTRTCEFRSAPKLDRYAEKEIKERNRYREPVYEDVEISLADKPQTDGASEIRLVLKGDMRICYLRVLKNKSTGKIQMGVAN